jgi:hypothetical protein
MASERAPVLGKVCLPRRVQLIASARRPPACGPGQGDDDESTVQQRASTRAVAAALLPAIFGPQNQFPQRPAPCVAVELMELSPASQRPFLLPLRRSSHPQKPKPPPHKAWIMSTSGSSGGILRTSSVPVSHQRNPKPAFAAAPQLQRANSTGSPLTAAASKLSSPSRSSHHTLSRQRSEVIAVQASGSSSTSKVSNQVLDAAFATHQWTICDSDKSQSVCPPNQSDVHILAKGPGISRSACLSAASLPQPRCSPPQRSRHIFHRCAPKHLRQVHTTSASHPSPSPLCTPSNRPLLLPIRLAFNLLNDVQFLLM